MNNLSFYPNTTHEIPDKTDINHYKKNPMPLMVNGLPYAVKSPSEPEPNQIKPSFFNGLFNFFCSPCVLKHSGKSVNGQPPLNSSSLKGIKPTIINNAQGEPYTSALPGNAVKIQADGHEKERIIGYYNSPFLNDKKLFGMYRSSGDNSGLEGTYLAHVGVNFKIMKPADGDGPNHFETYNNMNFDTTLLDSIRTEHPSISEEQISRFGNTEAMYVSYRLGGVVWKKSPWSDIGVKLESMYKGKLDSTVLPSSQEIKTYNFNDTAAILDEFKGGREVVKYNLHTGFEGRGIDLEGCEVEYL
ncbi:hypothetical protein [Aeromonas jandaei]|uniref:hypothetical protein n=1 Tax=Aeromonas jandaei TaxID=650 RepID=UPI003BA1B6CC